MAAMLHDFVRTHVCRAHAPASHATCHDDHENSNAWFSNFLCSHEPMGLRSAALRAAVELRYDGQDSLEFLVWYCGMVGSRGSIGSSKSELAIVKNSSREHIFASSFILLYLAFSGE